MVYPPLFHFTPHFIVQFKDIQFAYEVLSDPEKRERYDHFGMAGVTDDAAGPSECRAGGSKLRLVRPCPSF